MVLKLRLSRVSTPGGARRHLPRYNIVLAHARTARDSKPLEVLGTYDPIPKLPVGAPEGGRKQKDIKVDVSRAKYWLGVGAQPSDTVWRLLSMVRRVDRTSLDTVLSMHGNEDAKTNDCVFILQIGLLEPRYLPTGPQTDKALKAVRFPTHQPPRDRQQTPKSGTRATTDSISKSTRKAATIGAGTTSPEDPNAA